MKRNHPIQKILDAVMEAPQELESLKLFKRKLVAPKMDILSCVGMRHQFFAPFLQERKQEGTTIILVPDTANKHDPQAIACYVSMPDIDKDNAYTWIRAGYISASQTHLIKDRTKIYEGVIYAKHHDWWSVQIKSIREF